MAEREAAQAHRGTQAAYAALLPTLNGQLTERFTNATGFQGKEALFNGGLSLSFRADVAGVYATRGQRVAEQTAALTVERERQAVRDQLHSDWHRTRAAQTKLEASRAQVQAATQALTRARDRYGAGVASQLDVL